MKYSGPKASTSPYVGLESGTFTLTSILYMEGEKGEREIIEFIIFSEFEIKQAEHIMVMSNISNMSNSMPQEGSIYVAYLSSV